MAAPETWYAKTVEVSVSGGAGESRLLSQANSFAGSLTFGANSLVVGDVILLRASGRYSSSTTTQITVRLRQYFNPNAALQDPCADTGTVTNLIDTTSNKQWHFETMLTVRTTGANATLICDGFFAAEIPTNTPPAIWFAGVAQRSIDTTVDNTMELTVTVVGSGSFDLKQCSIEKLESP